MNPNDEALDYALDQIPTYEMEREYVEAAEFEFTGRECVAD